MLRNLFAIKGLGRLLLSPLFWRFWRLLALAVLLLMVAYGWHQHALPGVAVPDPLMYTNLATWMLWVGWLMGVVFLALLFGRLWCSFCPLGWLNGLVSRYGLKRSLPRQLNNHIPVTLTLVLLQLAVYLLAVHRYPDYTSLLLTLTLLLVVACGLLFRQRAFCTLFCPAGAVLGLYARVAPFELRVRERQQCQSCESRSCVSGESFWHKYSLGRAVLYWQQQRTDCPVDLAPAELSDASGCTLCLHCAQNCCQDNLRLGRRPWLAELGRRGLSGSEAFFLLVLLGMVTANLSKVNVPLRELLFWAPKTAALALGWQATGYFSLAALWVTLLLPLLLLLPGLLIYKLRHFSAVQLSGGPDGPPPQTLAKGGQFWSALGQLLLPYIPLVLAAHLILALVKLNAKLGYLPLVLAEPSGVRSYLAIHVMQTMAQPGVLLSLDLLKWLVLLLLVAGYLLSLLGARKAARQLFPDSGSRCYLLASLVGLSLTAGLYLDTVIRWLFIR